MDIVPLLTQFVYEKKWTKTSEKEALEIIAREMPETDPEATLQYILQEVKKGEQVTLAECRFKADKQGVCSC